MMVLSVIRVMPGRLFDGGHCLLYISVFHDLLCDLSLGPGGCLHVRESGGSISEDELQLVTYWEIS